MYRIKPKYLLWVLDGLVNREVKNQITVDPDTAKLARIALARMLEI
jgi:quinolinate synthase